jgi:hypothetical protein
MIIAEYNTTTGEILERQATTQELAQQKIDQAEAKAEAEAEAKAAADKAALLAKLGITADEAKLLFS